MLEKLQAQGGYVVTPEEKTRLQNTIWTDGHLSTAIVAQPAEKIAGMAGIDLPAGKQVFIVPETGAGPDHPFSGETPCVVMAYRKRVGSGRGGPVRGGPSD